MSRHLPPARRCLSRCRFPNLPTAEKAAQRGQRPALCWTCGGFHLTTTTTANGATR